MEYKQLVQYFTDEIKAESIATRKCLERIPETLYKFKPHEKSMELGYLALLVAEIPNWISEMIRKATIDLATYQQFSLGDTASLLKHYEKNLKAALDALAEVREDQLNVEFTLKHSGQLLYSSPMLKSVGESVNHWVHHRGQLTVYMRLNDIAVPSIYGPSADEKEFQRQN
jgi:uncharacterized damage-inducible protein DinB